MIGALQRHQQIFSRCALAIQIFYAVVFVEVFQQLIDLADNISAGVEPVPILSWLNFLHLTPTDYQSVAYLCVPAILPAFFFPHSRLARWLAGLSTLIFFGLYASIAERQTDRLVFVWIALYLMTLPNWQLVRSRSTRQKVIFGWWMCTGLFLITYCLSGLWKVGYAMIWQPLNGEWGAFSPLALSRVISDYLLRADQPSWLGDFFIHHAWLGWPAYLGAIFLEVLAPLPLFRPRYYRLFAVLLLEFHIFSAYILHIAFAGHIALIFLMLYFSPFAYPPTNSRPFSSP